MSAGRLFAVLMLFSFLSAFVLPARWFASVRAPVQGMFAPVSRPTRAIAAAVYRRANPESVIDPVSPRQPRPESSVYTENARLRAELAALQLRFNQLSRLNADRQLVGDLFTLCKPAAVTGIDSSGIRDALKIAGVGSNAFGRPVVHGNDLVGRVQAAGLTGAEVRLLTDPGFGFTVRFARYASNADGGVTLVKITALHPLVQGIGHGAMAVRSQVSMQQVDEAQLAVGDLAVLDDRDVWTPNVQGLSVGRVTGISPQANAPIFADIRIEPASDLSRLNEVMVVVKD